MSGSSVASMARKPKQPLSRAEMIAAVIRTAPLLERELAELFGITERHVRRVRAEVRRMEKVRQMERAVALANSRATAGVFGRESA